MNTKLKTIIAIILFIITITLGYAAYAVYSTEQKYNMSTTDFLHGTKPTVGLPWGLIISSGMCLIIGMVLIKNRK